jgi:hypothetical protein
MAGVGVARRSNHRTSAASAGNGQFRWVAFSELAQGQIAKQRRKLLRVPLPSADADYPQPMVQVHVGSRPAVERR